MAQHVVPSLHTTFLPAECHNLLVQYFILLVWLHWLFSVKTLVCHLFFCGSIGKENRESWNRTACLQTLVTSPAPWLDTGSWVVFGVSQQMKYLSANLEGPIQAAGVHGKAAHTLHVESKAQCAPSEGTQEPFDSTSLADVAPKDLYRVRRQIHYSRLPQKFLLCLEMWIT